MASFITPFSISTLGNARSTGTAVEFATPQRFPKKRDSANQRELEQAGAFGLPFFCNRFSAMVRARPEQGGSAYMVAFR